MADYPALLIDQSGFKEIWQDEVLLSRSRAGGVRGRLLSTGRKLEWDVPHRFLTAAEKDAFEAFYDANRALVFNFTPLTTPYEAKFGDPLGLDWRPEEEDRWSVTVRILEA